MVKRISQSGRALRSAYIIILVSIRLWKIKDKLNTANISNQIIAEIKFLTKLIIIALLNYRVVKKGC